jgi:hypothetical protein
MTRLGQAGFEVGDSSAYGADAVGSNATNAVALVTASPAPRSGTYCCRCLIGDPTNTTTWTEFHAKKVFLHASKTEMWYALGVQAHHPTEAAAAGSCLLLVFHDAAGNANVLITLDAGTLRAYYATAGGATPSFGQCTLIGAASSAMSMDAWHLLEVRIVAATGATGNFELYLDGSSVISASSQRTAQTSANLASFALTTGGLQSIALMGANTWHAFDDVRYQDTAGSVNNGRPGDEAIRLLVPTAAGDSADLSRGGTDSGANWSQVDEVPPGGGTDYVHSGTVGHTDLYATTDFPVAAISAISVLAQVANSDGAGGTVYLPTKTGAGQSDGSAYALTPAWTYQSRLLEADPADAAAWSSAKLAALQIGCKIAS